MSNILMRIREKQGSSSKGESLIGQERATIQKYIPNKYYIEHVSHIKFQIITNILSGYG